MTSPFLRFEEQHDGGVLLNRTVMGLRERFQLEDQHGLIKDLCKNSYYLVRHAAALIVDMIPRYPTVEANGF